VVLRHHVRSCGGGEGLCGGSLHILGRLLFGRLVELDKDGKIRLHHVLIRQVGEVGQAGPDDGQVDRWVLRRLRRLPVPLLLGRLLVLMLIGWVQGMRLLLEHGLLLISRVLLHRILWKILLVWLLMLGGRLETRLETRPLLLLAAHSGLVLTRRCCV
jgi:hypothetical protein